MKTSGHKVSPTRLSQHDLNNKGTSRLMWTEESLWGLKSTHPNNSMHLFSKGTYRLMSLEPVFPGHIYSHLAQNVEEFMFLNLCFQRTWLLHLTDLCTNIPNASPSPETFLQLWNKKIKAQMSSCEWCICVRVNVCDRFWGVVSLWCMCVCVVCACAYMWSFLRHGFTIFVPA